MPKSLAHTSQITLSPAVSFSELQVTKEKPMQLVWLSWEGQQAEVAYSWR